MKNVYVEAFFPELPGGVCNQTGRATASTIRSGIARAIDDAIKHTKRRKGASKKLTGHRFTIIQAKIVITEAADQTEDSNVQR